ncbi:MAG: isoprenylcysteine carboxylmethyltransferase family protein [candidate division Zixibacteria bacterium]|nr:isoprenylcysteine carboxylmethyltransferase family protein [candidate division Zixibacteria bacterium]
MTALKTLLFTIIVPGTVTILLPYQILSSVGEGHSLSIGLIRYFGALPITLGILMYLRCAWDFTFIGRGTPLAVDPPRTLVIRGHYQNVRNPMYVGIVLLLLGEALLFESPSLLGYASLMFLMFHLFIVLYEEPALKRKFGESYELYRGATPRWILKTNKQTFANTFSRVAALTYFAGTIAHTLRVVFEYPIEQVITVIHGPLVLASGYAGAGFLYHARKALLNSGLKKALYGLIAFHLITTAIMHAYSMITGNEEWIGFFPIWYSYFAIAYFVIFGYFCLKLRIKQLN